jgi:hypothetical protein
MNKEYQELFYKAVGEIVSQKMKEKNTTISRVATRSGNQYNTIKYVAEGKPFYFHQALWLKDILGLSTDKLIEQATTKLFRESFDGKEKEETNKEESKGIQSFI